MFLKKLKFTGTVLAPDNIRHLVREVALACSDSLISGVDRERLMN